MAPVVPGAVTAACHLGKSLLILQSDSRACSCITEKPHAESTVPDSRRQVMSAALKAKVQLSIVESQAFVPQPIWCLAAEM